MNSRQLKVALIQMQGDADRNTCWQRIEKGIVHASQQDAKLILLQELHNGLYFCQQESSETFDLAETIPGPSTEYFGKLARKHNIVIVTSLFEKRTAGIYHNTAVVIDTNGEIAGKYRKMHIPDDPGYYEKFYFTPGDIGFQPIITSIGKIGVLICWDQWFPEAARLMALAGADILCYPTAIGWTADDNEDQKIRHLQAWTTVQRGHAIANSIPVLVCNRVGYEANPMPQQSGLEFWGSSFIAGPQGELIATASDKDAEVLLADIDLAHCESVRRMWPYLRDRRIDAYQDLMQRYLD